MLATIESGAVMGIDAYDVQVEVDVSSHIAYFAIVGLPDAAVNEAKERVRAAIKNGGLVFPLRRFTLYTGISSCTFRFSTTGGSVPLSRITSR
jgi:magnesium chelatase family protein